MFINLRKISNSVKSGSPEPEYSNVRGSVLIELIYRRKNCEGVLGIV